MDSYIVRIYRRTGEPHELAGQIEKAGTEINDVFHNSGELVRILTSGCELCGNVGVEAALLQERDADRSSTVTEYGHYADISDE